MVQAENVTDLRGSKPKAFSIKGLIGKIKEHPLYKKLKGVKNIELIIAAVVCGLILIIYLGVGYSSKKAKTETATDTVVTADASAELESILSKIKGAGKVRVLITYDGDGEKIPAESTSRYSYTTTDESGEKSSTSQTVTETKNTVLVSSGGTSSALILKQVSPKIVGVVIVAEGAESSNVKVALWSAAQAATGAGIDRIRIFEME